MNETCFNQKRLWRQDMEESINFSELSQLDLENVGGGVAPLVYVGVVAGSALVGGVVGYFVNAK